MRVRVDMLLMLPPNWRCVALAPNLPQVNLAQATKSTSPDPPLCHATAAELQIAKFYSFLISESRSEFKLHDGRLMAMTRGCVLSCPVEADGN